MKDKFKIDEILEGEIIDFTHEGNGVMRVDNFTVFVKDGLIGDRVKAKVDDVKKNFALATMIEILEASKDRVKNPIDLSESKGGIPLIDYEYGRQLEWKRDKVVKDLERIAKIENIKVKKTIGMENPYGYRNHIQIPVGEEKGSTVLGFYEMNSRNIVDMKETILGDEVANKIIKTIRRWIEEYKIQAYNRKNRRGKLRHIGIRTNRDNQAMVILVTGSNNLPKEKELVEMLKEENVVSIYHNINKSKSSMVYGREYRKIYGQDSLVDYIGDYRFNISPNSFFQVNRSQAEILYHKAIEYLDLEKDDIIYDLYCGIGTISLYIVEKARKVYGIEVVKAAIENAEENKKVNQIDNVEFIVGKAEEIFPRHIKKGIKANKVVVDPPRKGCEKEVLEAIVKLNPEKLVYVSCNPSTMARDVKYLVEEGYKVEEVQPVDMFPHTAHIETIALLTR